MRQGRNRNAVRARLDRTLAGAALFRPYNVCTRLRARLLKTAITILLCAISAFAAGCSDSEDSEAAIAAAIDSHLGLRTDLGAGRMRVELAQVKFQGDEATAAVTITARDDPNASMQMMYRLTRTADGWEVQDPRGEEGAAESRPRRNGAAGLPAGHPPVEGQPESTGELPPGHPPVTESQPRAELPKGHPPVSN